MNIFLFDSMFVLYKKTSSSYTNEYLQIFQKFLWLNLNFLSEVLQNILKSESKHFAL